MHSPFNHIIGKSLERLAHFLWWYCGAEITKYIEPGDELFKCKIPIPYGITITHWSDTPKTEWAIRELMSRKAHGFLIYEGDVLCFYKWDGENSDIPTFDFVGEESQHFMDRQAELKEQAIADHTTGEEDFGRL